MKYLRRPVLFIAISAMVLGLAQMPALAVEDATLTDAQLVQIRGNCSEIKATLARVHANDALLRVNRGRLYELVSTKLMARLNSRIALNRLDSSSLVAVTNNYEAHIKMFRASYQLYEESLSDLTKIDCKNQPVKFYTTLQATRERRSDVHFATQVIINDINEYQDAFTAFAKPYSEEKS